MRNQEGRLPTFPCAWNAQAWDVTDTQASPWQVGINATRSATGLRSPALLCGQIGHERMTGSVFLLGISSHVILDSPCGGDK